MKTADKEIRVGLDGAEPLEIAKINSSTDVEWNKISGRVSIPKELNSAALYIETDGRADFFVDNVFIKPVR